ncbi:hypothetical protein LTS10_013127 [Elasticomyces elasticus]|nr:hypothetical protein LTS10_013127 [Elasticomyces elasticus]
MGLLHMYCAWESDNTGPIDLDTLAKVSKSPAEVKLEQLADVLRADIQDVFDGVGRDGVGVETWRKLLERVEEVCQVDTAVLR